MHEVKKPFAGIKKLSIWHGKPFFLLQKPFFLKIKPFKKTFFFHKVELTACTAQNGHLSQWIYSQFDQSNSTGHEILFKLG